MSCSFPQHERNNPPLFRSVLCRDLVSQFRPRRASHHPIGSPGIRIDGPKRWLMACFFPTRMAIYEHMTEQPFCISVCMSQRPQRPAFLPPATSCAESKAMGLEARGAGEGAGCPAQRLPTSKCYGIVAGNVWVRNCLHLVNRGSSAFACPPPSPGSPVEAPVPQPHAARSATASTVGPQAVTQGLFFEFPMPHHARVGSPSLSNRDRETGSGASVVGSRSLDCGSSYAYMAHSRYVGHRGHRTGLGISHLEEGSGWFSMIRIVLLDGDRLPSITIQRGLGLLLVPACRSQGVVSVLVMVGRALLLGRTS
jgi:hypothetical protein